MVVVLMLLVSHPAKLALPAPPTVLLSIAEIIPSMELNSVTEVALEQLEFLLVKLVPVALPLAKYNIVVMVL